MKKSDDVGRIVGKKMRQRRTNLKFLRRRRRNSSLLQIDSFLNCHKMVEYDG